MPVEQIETLVIGGGQAGLVMSHRLKQRGLARTSRFQTLKNTPEM
jgi:cation diffusion facilitator CzcD-associated flavoprotein CzcO